VKPQLVPLQVAVASAGGEQAVHDVAPHELVNALLTHAPEQSWYPLAQVKPQLVPSHVAVAFATVGQAVHELPHVAVALLLTQVVPHSWKPVAQWPASTPASGFPPPSLASAPLDESSPASGGGALTSSLPASGTGEAWSSLASIPGETEPSGDGRIVPSGRDASVPSTPPSAESEKSPRIDAHPAVRPEKEEAKARRPKALLRFTASEVSASCAPR
jgi:hypothetical protein